MDEEEKQDATEETETPSEEARQEETGETPEEAHRAGEFDELRDLMQSIRDEIAGLRSTIADMMVERPAEEAPAPEEEESGDSDLIDIDELDL